MTENTPDATSSRRLGWLCATAGVGVAAAWQLSPVAVLGVGLTVLGILAAQRLK